MVFVTCEKGRMEICENFAGMVGGRFFSFTKIIPVSKVLCQNSRIQWPFAWQLSFVELTKKLPSRQSNFLVRLLLLLSSLRLCRRKKVCCRHSGLRDLFTNLIYGNVSGICYCKCTTAMTEKKNNANTKSSLNLTLTKTITCTVNLKLWYDYIRRSRIIPVPTCFLGFRFRR